MKAVVRDRFRGGDFIRGASCRAEPMPALAKGASTAWGRCVRCPVVVLVLLVLAWLPFAAGAGVPPPADLGQRAGFDQRLAGQVPMALHFRDADGRTVTLAELAGGKPTLLALGYYRCPNLCDLVLHGIAHALPGLRLRPGKDYQVVFASIDPREKPADARDTARMLARMNPAAEIDRWHLLTGDQASIHALAQAVGFRYFHDSRNDQYAHAAGLVVLTGQGEVAQYFFGVSYPPDALRLSLVDASRGRLGNLIDQLVLLCCSYDPSTGRYSLLIGRVMQGLGIGFVLLMLAGLYWSRRKAGT
jgi:protein SCO1/2